MDSNLTTFWYYDVTPYVHYIPFHNSSDLVQKAMYFISHFFASDCHIDISISISISVSFRDTTNKSFGNKNHGTDIIFMLDLLDANDVTEFGLQIDRNDNITGRTVHESLCSICSRGCLPRTWYQTTKSSKDIWKMPRKSMLNHCTYSFYECDPRVYWSRLFWGTISVDCQDSRFNQVCSTHTDH